MDVPHSVMLAALLLFAASGHAFLWIGLLNRFDAVGAPRRVVKAMTGSCLLCMIVLPVVGLVWALGQREPLRAILESVRHSHVLQAYLAVCCIVTPVTLIRLVCLCYRWPPSIVRFHRRRRLPIVSITTRGGWSIFRRKDAFGVQSIGREHGPVPFQSADTRNSPPIADSEHHLFARLPGNETLQLELSEWVFDMPQLDAALDGLSIVHISDLHLTGSIGKSYFHEVVERCNELQADLVAITGDLADAAACLDWTGEILGRLTARQGVYFVLGNHDRRISAPRLRQILTDRGLIDLGGRSVQIAIRGRPVVLAGNERPWIGVAPNLDDHLSPTHEGRALCIALTHTPDQLRWARAHGVDLLLAGHTHGGQIRIPPLGAILSPTFSGVKHVSGVYHCPPTVLHVTRGVSGSIPFRWNCPPEVALLRLHAGTRRMAIDNRTLMPTNPR
jgi:predicted MPP superfamily phosphohydrolase